MSKRDILEIGIKLLGLYCVISFFSSIPGIGMAINTANSDFVSSPFLYIFMPCLLSCAYLILAIVFLAEGHAIANRFIKDVPSEDTATQNTSILTTLSFWMILIGIYYFISSVASLISTSAYLTRAQLGTYSFAKLLSQAVIFILSLLLIFKSKAIAKFITVRSKSST
ncbi:MAG: hypothetical protein PHN82_02545 [bacterium]|nr:hypothetical protein [bacterium]